MPQIRASIHSRPQTATLDTRYSAFFCSDARAYI